MFVHPLPINKSGEVSTCVMLNLAVLWLQTCHTIKCRASTFISISVR